MVTKAMPRWATPERQQALVNLFEQSHGFCVYGHKNCLNPDHHYENFIGDLIKDWQGSDREERAMLWEIERKAIHSLGERMNPLRGRFSAVSREIYHGDQPLYYLVGLGFSGVTQRPFAKIRVSSSYMVLHVDLGELLRRKFAGKCKRRKAARYGKPQKLDPFPEMAELIERAIRDYRSK